MHKKLMVACMAIAAFAAFVVAPAASASPALTKSGVLLAKGSAITGTNTGATLFEGGFAVECSSADLSGTLTENTGTKIKGEVPVGSASFTGTGAGGDCTSALGDTKPTVTSKLCLETKTGTDEVTVTGCGSAVTFTLNVTSAGITCAYSATSVTGTYKTAAAATVNLSKQAAARETGQNIFCPSSGSLTMDFDLSSGGTALTIS